MFGAELELEGAARQQPDGERVGDNHDDEGTEERRQGPVDEEVCVEDGALEVVVEYVGRPVDTEDYQWTGDNERDYPRGADLGANNRTRPIPTLYSNATTTTRIIVG